MEIPDIDTKSMNPELPHCEYQHTNKDSDGAMQIQKLDVGLYKSMSGILNSSSDHI